MSVCAMRPLLNGASSPSSISRTSRSSSIVRPPRSGRHPSRRPAGRRLGWRPDRGGLTMLDDRDVRLIEEGDEAPFSKGLMAQTLMATGLAPEQAYGVAAAVERRLRRRGPAALTLADLHKIAREQLGDLKGDILIQRFRQWQTLRRLETPLMVLTGAATGVGKTRLATSSPTVSASRA